MIWIWIVGLRRPYLRTSCDFQISHVFESIQCIAAFRPKFHVLSNGALVFGVSLILCTGKWIKVFTETLHIQPLFSAYRTQLVARARVKCAMQKNLKCWTKNNIIFYIYPIFVLDFYLWRIWEIGIGTWKAVGTHMNLPLRSEIDTPILSMPSSVSFRSR
jgi:hypothetical protein